MKNTRKLWLVRHANAMDKIQGDTDFNRELAPEGLREATYLGELLKSKKMVPDAIVSSSAVRAAGTAIILGEKTGDSKDVIQKKDLYEASVRTILHNVNVLKNEWKNVLIVAHNPGIHYFAEYIAGAVIDRMEPCALVEVTFDLESWKLVSERSGEFQQYIPPFRPGK